MKIPLSKEDFVEKAEKDVLDVEQQYTDGLITSGEKYNKVVDIWSKVTEDVANEMMDEIKVDYFRDKDGTTWWKLRVSTRSSSWRIPAPVDHAIRSVSLPVCVV
jgi:DNA-directed RNA polymerase beta' subunit